jgi:hypothetical protein
MACEYDPRLMHSDSTQVAKAKCRTFCTVSVIRSGGTLITSAKFDPKLFCESVQRYKVSHYLERGEFS